MKGSKIEITASDPAFNRQGNSGFSRATRPEHDHMLIMLSNFLRNLVYDLVVTIDNPR
jgi:hypothetical protein